MDKQYKASEHEDKIFQKWEKSGAFTPSDKGEPYCIIMPPPNANDPLHVGHAMFVTLEDIFIRYQRMQGKSVLWLPGTDHAGIETQFVFEKKLKKQGKSRFDYDRKTLFKMIFRYVEENSGIAIDQMKKIGASADWDRTKFTLDKEIVDKVLDTFIELHKDGLVYRDLQLVNYCTRCGTAFSNLEVEHTEKQAPLYYMKYGPFSLATTRPETKFGDTAIAVNPKDKRYAKWVGKTVEVEGLIGKFKIKVIADDHVDPEFGTGVVKITPAHDFNDFEVGKRHNLEVKQVVGFDGKLNERCGKYKGMTVISAREQVVKDLQEKGLMEKIDDKYTHSVGSCYRCGRVIEPLPLPQFFIKVKSLTEKALKALKDKKTVVYGSGHDKILKHWLENLKDWNVSRQIVWGIQLPVWYCQNGKKQSSKVGPSFTNVQVNGTKSAFRKRSDLIQCFVVSKTRPKKCDSCGSNKFVQEEDTFDTWFSSAQWPWVTLQSCPVGQFNKETPSGSAVPTRHSAGSPVKESPSSGTLFDRFYPSNVMETGYDILPFWVMRMLMMGLYKTGKVPFEKVYLHGLIRDSKGQKMSKSKGNVLNPLEVVEKYGADALRIALVMSSTAGNDKAVGEETIKGMRNLTNKIWNAARFVTEFLDQTNKAGPKDAEFEKKLEETVEEVTDQMEKMKPGLAAETVYNRFWHWFCDESIEAAKKCKIGYPVLEKGLKTFLKLLHPFVPFVTEAVWGELDEDKLLIKSEWPDEKVPN